MAGKHEKRFDPEKRLARLTEKLSLTAEQQAQIRPIFAAQTEALKTINNTPLTKDQRREQLRELRRSNHAQIGAILTPEQRRLLAEMRHDRHRRRGEHRHGPEAAPQPVS